VAKSRPVYFFVLLH